MAHIKISFELDVACEPRPLYVLYNRDGYIYHSNEPFTIEEALQVTHPLRTSVFSLARKI